MEKTTDEKGQTLYKLSEEVPAEKALIDIFKKIAGYEGGIKHLVDVLIEKSQELEASKSEAWNAARALTGDDLEGASWQGNWTTGGGATIRLKIKTGGAE